MHNIAERHLRVIGLELGATLPEAEAKYRVLVRMWHPDRFNADPASADEATERLKRINESMSWLRNHETLWSGVRAQPQAQQPREEPRARETRPPDDPPRAERGKSTGAAGGAKAGAGSTPKPPPAPPSVAEPTQRPGNVTGPKVLVMAMFALVLVVVVVNQISAFQSSRPSPSVPRGGSDAGSLSAPPTVPTPSTSGVATRQSVQGQEVVHVEGHEIVYTELLREPWGDLWVVTQEAVTETNFFGHMTADRTKVLDSLDSEILLIEGIGHTNKLLDFNGDGQPELVFEGHTGGSGCCAYLGVYGNVDGSVQELVDIYIQPYELADLDGDSQLELVTFSRVLFGPLPNCCAPAIPLVMKWSTQGWEDVTSTLGREILEAEIVSYRERLVEEHARDPMSIDAQAAVGGLLGTALILGPDRAERELAQIRRTVHRELSAWLVNRIPDLVADLDMRDWP